MARSVIHLRKRFLLIVEGQDELHFISLISAFCAQKDLPIHIVRASFNGGSIKNGLIEAELKQKQEKEKEPLEECFFVYDTDRLDEEGLTESDIIRWGEQNNFKIIPQKNNFECLLLQLLNKNEGYQNLTKQAALAILKKRHNYPEKLISRQQLSRLITLEHLETCEKHNKYLYEFLKKIGFSED